MAVKIIVEYNGRKYTIVKMRGGLRLRSTTDPRTYLARDVMEYNLGYCLLPNDVVHHKDGDTLNNLIDNLIVRQRGEHSSEHILGIKRSKETCRKISVGKSKPNPVQERTTRTGGVAFPIPISTARF